MEAKILGIYVVFMYKKQYNRYLMQEKTLQNRKFKKLCDKIINKMLQLEDELSDLSRL